MISHRCLSIDVAMFVVLGDVVDVATVAIVHIAISICNVVVIAAVVTIVIAPLNLRRPWLPICYLLLRLLVVRLVCVSPLLLLSLSPLRLLLLLVLCWASLPPTWSLLFVTVAGRCCQLRGQYHYCRYRCCCRCCVRRWRCYC